MKKRALITGITGQDGYYLSKLLAKKGYKVYGLVRRSSNDSFIRFKNNPELLKSINVIYGNIRDASSIRKALEISKPDEIYNLAALSDVGVSFQCPEETFDINYYGVGRLVKEARKTNPKVRIYQASTSEMFGKTPPPQDEESLFQPVSPYAEAKLKAHRDYVVGYRKKYNLFICSGILFNHESPLRGDNFVTRKITKSLAKIKLGSQDCLELGNLGAKRDWGFAGDYVEAMYKMLQRKKPEDFVVATGKSHSVKDFVDSSAKALNIKLYWEGEGLKQLARDKHGKIIVKVNEKFYRPSEVQSLRSDAVKARKVLGWRPKVSFEELVTMMAKSDLKNARSI